MRATYPRPHLRHLAALLEEKRARRPTCRILRFARHPRFPLSSLFEMTSPRSETENHHSMFVAQAGRGTRFNPSVCLLSWIRRRNAPRYPLAHSLSLVDLFSGCGCMTLGAKEAARMHGFSVDVRLAVDIDPHALGVFADNHPTTQKALQCANMATLFDGALGASLTLSERRIRKSVGDLDLLISGPPCQGYSDLNNKTRRKDPRNQLYLKSVRAVEVLRPRSVLFENVAPILHGNMRVVDQAKAALERLGYSHSSLVANASEFGIPQTRRRHFLVASRDFELAISLDVYRRPTPHLVEFIGDLADEPTQDGAGIFATPSPMSEDNKKRAAYLFRTHSYDLPDAMRPKCHSAQAHKYISMYGRLRPDQPAQTITSGSGSMGQGRYLHPLQERTLTPHEAARIQGLPEFFDFGRVANRKVIRRLIGNAVIPRLAAMFVDQILGQESPQ